MDLTLVVICCDDPHVFQAIASAGGPVPTVVSLVPNAELEKALLEQGVRVVHSRRGNYSVSINRGLAAADTRRAFIMDSDCTLDPSCVDRIDRLLDEAPVARARIAFEHDPTVFCSRQIGALRDSVNNRNPAPAYTPGLGLHLDLAPALGGFFFDERIGWGGDSEFSRRATQAGLRIAYDPEAVVNHKAIGLGHEIGSGYRFGFDCHTQVKLGLRPSWEHPQWIVRRLLSAMRHRNPPAVQPRIDGTAKLIRLGWWLAFYAGYYRCFLPSPRE